MVTNNTGALKFAHEYAQRWRKTHDAYWVVNEVYNKVHAGPWRGFQIADYRLTPEEQILMDDRLQAAEQARKEREEGAARAAIEAAEAVKQYQQMLDDLTTKGVTRCKVSLPITISVKVTAYRESVRRHGTDAFEAACEAILEAFQAATGAKEFEVSEGIGNWKYDGTDYNVYYDFVFETDYPGFTNSDDELTEVQEAEIVTLFMKQMPEEAIDDIETTWVSFEWDVDKNNIDFNCLEVVGGV